MRQPSYRKNRVARVGRYRHFETGSFKTARLGGPCPREPLRAGPGIGMYDPGGVDLRSGFR